MVEFCTKVHGVTTSSMVLDEHDFLTAAVMKESTRMDCGMELVRVSFFFFLSFFFSSLVVFAVVAAAAAAAAAVAVAVAVADHDHFFSTLYTLISLLHYTRRPTLC